MKERFTALLIVVAGAVLSGAAPAAGGGATGPAKALAKEPEPVEAPVPAMTPEEQAAVKEKDLAVRAALEQRILEIGADPAKSDLYIRRAQERTALCKHCHGEDGNSANAVIPSLAGQSAVYLVDQFNRFSDERRYDYWMSGLARTISDDDKIRLAIYYASQTTQAAGGGDATLLDKGRQLFEQFCVECHGADAKGKEGYARLAGQQPGYVVKMLKEFKDGTGRRYNPWMAARANMLGTEENMLAVATYVASLE